ncbi:MAG: thioredoxin [Bacteroidales bacterium]
MKKMRNNSVIAFLALFAAGIFLSSCSGSGAADKEESGQTGISMETGQSQSVAEAGDKTETDLKPIYLTTEEFKEKVWDYEANPEEWVYNGELPCVVDFYADWCKPCKMVAPIMDDLADYYTGRVQFYKVNTDNERELSMVFQIRSIPAILFAPGEGRPAMQTGAMTKEDYIKIIDEFVLKINENNKTES